MDNEPADDLPAPSEPAAPATAPTGAAPRTKPVETTPAGADEHGGGGWRNWGRGVEGPLAIAALVVAVIALLVGTAGLVEARRADTKKSHPATSSSSSSGQVAVPNMVGETGVNATVKLKAAKLQSKNVRQTSATVAKGRVMSQDPAAGTNVAEQTVVTLTVSDGPASASGAPPSS